EGNIDADPDFRSVGPLAWLLGPGSPSVDAGDSTLEDRISDWHPRWPLWYPNEPRNDMGAYGGEGNAGWLESIRYTRSRPHCVRQEPITRGNDEVLDTERPEATLCARRS
ncbi:MAG: hypothetical protein CME06_13915, partial [Gemmatimonadetes bacterium]|nr:hypothetical protein [Gemmatimonadota bacterium]